MWRLNAQTRNENNNELPEDVEEIQNLNHLIPDDQIHFLVKSSLQNQVQFYLSGTYFPVYRLFLFPP